MHYLGLKVGVGPTLASSVISAVQTLEIRTAKGSGARRKLFVIPRLLQIEWASEE